MVSDAVTTAKPQRVATIFPNFYAPPPNAHAAPGAMDMQAHWLWFVEPSPAHVLRNSSLGRFGAR